MPTPEGKHGPLVEEAWDFFRSELRAPSSTVLYHYTSREGLLSILRARRMWATDLRFMNDTEELAYSLNLIGDVLDNTAIRQGDFQRALFLALMKRQLGKVIEKSSFYSISFCEEADRPSQWQDYGIGGSGFALGWSVDSPHPEVPLRIGVVYDPDRQRRLVQGMVDLHLASFSAEKDLTRGSGLEAMSRAAASLGVSLNIFVSNFKREKWADEREYRYVYQALDGRLPVGTVLKMRPAGPIEKPYIETDFTQASLKLVIAGPSNDPSATALWLRTALDSNGYSGTPIYRSDQGG